MGRMILGCGTAMIVVLLGMLFAWGEPTLYQLTLFFSTFIFLQFWNMFNAKTYGSNRSAFHDLCKSEGFLLVAFLILAGQILVVHFGGSVFRTVPLSWGEWLTCILATSLVLWVGELFRAFKRVQR